VYVAHFSKWKLLLGLYTLSFISEMFLASDRLAIYYSILTANRLLTSCSIKSRVKSTINMQRSSEKIRTTNLIISAPSENHVVQPRAPHAMTSPKCRSRWSTGRQLIASSAKHFRFDSSRAQQYSIQRPAAAEQTRRADSISSPHHSTSGLVDTKIPPSAKKVTTKKSKSRIRRGQPLSDNVIYHGHGLL